MPKNIFKGGATIVKFLVDLSIILDPIRKNRDL